jgi:F0F1-type ATP synthase assembly protein I
MDRSAQDSGGPGRDGRGRKTTEDSSPNAANLAGMGVQFVVAILLFLFVGKWLDARLGTAPWLLLLGVFVGAGASTYAMYRKAFPPEQSKRPGEPKPPSA